MRQISRATNRPMKRTGPGRPKLPSSKLVRNRYTVGFRDEDDRRIKACAKADGQTPQAWIAGVAVAKTVVQ